MERISLLQPANTAASSRQVPEKHLRLEPKNSILMTSVYPEFTTSCIISIIGFVWVKMADSVTRWCFYAAFHAEKHSEVMPEFWAVWCHQYEIFRIESQALQEATSNMSCTTELKIRLRMSVTYPLHPERRCMYERSFASLLRSGSAIVTVPNIPCNGHSRRRQSILIYRLWIENMDGKKRWIWKEK